MSILITLEGVDGSGKSTQAKLLANNLNEKGYNIISLREPGDTELGENLRELLNDHQGSNTSITDLSQLCLFLASRAQLVAEKIAPALSGTNNIVICDRYMDSTLAYQGYGMGFDIELIKRVNSYVVGHCKPSLTILIDCPIKVSVSRTIARTKKMSRFEAKANDFQKRVREGFISLANEEPKRWHVVDGTLNKITLSKQILLIAVNAIRDLSGQKTPE